MIRFFFRQKKRVKNARAANHGHSKLTLPQRHESIKAISRSRFVRRRSRTTSRDQYSFNYLKCLILFYLTVLERTVNASLYRHAGTSPVRTSSDPTVRCLTRSPGLKFDGSKHSLYPYVITAPTSQETRFGRKISLFILNCIPISPKASNYSSHRSDIILDTLRTRKHLGTTSQL
jgi:hypothetical protein